MIPIKLSIQGLYSYQDKQEIDFRRLTGSSVFGIFGKVGSGKTSLLEAISFALYGETERLNSRDNRLYNMMNLKSKGLKIDFEFQAGAHQQLYRFVYEAKRNSKKHHEVNPGERRTFIWQETDWHPIGNEKEDVSVLSKQILGIDYDNFKRTIIIPQNQFREFLELSAADRTKMMNQLFKLDQYDLTGRVKKLTSANDNQLAELRGLLSPLETATPEAVDAAKAEIASVEQSLIETTAKIDQLTPDEERLLFAKKQHESLISARLQLTQWLTDEVKFQLIEQDIAQYSRCQLLFRVQLDAVDKLRKQQTELTKNTQQAQRQLEIVSQQLPQLQETYTSAKVAYENRVLIQKQIDDLETVQAIRTRQKSIELLTKDRVGLDAKVAFQKKRIEQYKTELKSHQKRIDQLFGQESNLERLYKAKTWFEVFRPLKKQADALQAQLETNDDSVARLKQRKNNALVGFPSEWDELTLKTLPDALTQALEKFKRSEEKWAIVYQKALLEAELQRYAENLTDGKPCPLCGSAHHPAKHSDDAVALAVREADESLKAVRQKIEKTTALQLTISKLETELRAVLDNTKRFTEERGQVVQQLTLHEDKFVWSEFTIEQERLVDDAILREGNTQKELQNAQKAVRELNKDIDETLALLERDNQKLSSVTNDIAGLNGQLTHEIQSLEHYTLADVATWGLIYIADLRTSLTQQHEQVKIDFDEADKRRNEAEKEQATRQEQVKLLTKQLADIETDVVTQDEAINKSLADNDLLREEVEMILRSNLNVEQERKRVRDYQDKLTGLRKLVADLNTKLTEQPFDADTLLAIQDQLQTLRDQKDALNTDLGKASNVLAMLEQQWREKQEHQKRYDELDLRRQDLDKMNELFRAQGFVNYVSSVYLTNLCESANERFFKLTNNQLRLELDEKNNFLVRDFLNGGEVRSVKTLSGGQTFQASLSLALALSDNIQHLTKAKQNLFFLDEGFGTLDKDSLQTVFKTLKALRAENRVVGIISHVEELQQEVDTYIRTVATENGSRIICSWE